MDELSNVLVNILEETEYPDSVTSETFQWMTSVHELYPFYEWLINSISKDNLITDDELLCYNYIAKSGKLLKEEELDSRLNSYTNSKPTLFVDEVSVDGINSVIASKKKVLNQLNTLKARLKHKLQKKESENYDTSFVDQLLKEKLKNVHNVEEECRNQFHLLNRKIQVVLENVSALKNGDTKYVSQQDLTPYFLKNTNLAVYSEILKKKIFQDKKSEKLYSSLFLDEDDFANEVFYWLRNEECRVASYKAKELAADEVLKYLSDCDANIDNINYFFGNQNKYSSTKNKSLRPTEDDLLLSVEFYLKDIISGLQLNFCEERLSKKKESLLLLEEVENIVQVRNLCNSSLLYLLINECKMLRLSVSSVKEVFDYWQNEISEFEKRMSWMNSLIMKPNLPRNTFNENYNRFSRSFNESKLPSIESSQSQEIKTFYYSIKQYKENVSCNFKNYLSLCRNINSEIMKVDRLIFNGPTRTIRYNNDIVTILKEIYALISNQSVSINYEITQFNKFEESLESKDSLLNMMWYEWNKSPFNVMQAVLKMEEAVEINKRRLSIMADKQLSSIDFNEYNRF